MSSSYILTGTHIASLADAQGYGVVRDAAIVIQEDTIAYAGRAEDLPQAYEALPRTDLGKRWITPALIDCHSHIVHAGDRVHEFEMRLNGASYEAIAREGGGIISTVKATREASEAQLLELALGRAHALIGEGVATIEVKSGYGLDAQTELKMLRVARRLEKECAIRIKTSFLAAHAVPSGQDAEDYIDSCVLPTLERAYDEGLVDAVDGFCENIAFSAKQIERVFEKAKALGLPVKLHAEQLSHQGGTALAARYGALSVDHLEYANEADVRAMAKAGSTAVILPGAFYTIHETQKPPIDAFRQYGVPMAVATDWNPGSSPLGSLLLSMNMSATLFGMTPEETLRGTTINAARAMGIKDRGYIKKGMRADLAIWDISHPAELSYHIGLNKLYRRIFGGAQ